MKTFTGILDEVLVLMAMVLAVLVLCSGCASPESRIGYPNFHAIPEAVKIDRNLSQTGVHDRQVPLDTRQAHARKHGLQEPSE